MSDEKGRYSPEPIITVNGRFVCVLAPHGGMPWFDDVEPIESR